MKITKYPQSHLVISKDDHKIMIDPGDLTFESGFKSEEFADAEAIFITHIHADHLAQQHIDEFRQLVENKKIFGNSEVISKLKELGIEAGEAKNREKIDIAGFEIEPVDLPHFRLAPEDSIPKNTGFIIDRVFFDGGDGFELGGLTVENAALALGGPSLSSLGVVEFAKSLNAKVIIPIHYDIWKRDPAEINKIASWMNLNFDVRVLNFGESTEI